VAIRVRQTNGTEVKIIVLTREQALNAWKAEIAGHEQLILSRAQIYFDHDILHLSSADISELSAEFFPPQAHTPSGFARDDQMASSNDT